MKKKIGVLLLLCIITLGLTGCGNNNKENKTKVDSQGKIIVDTGEEKYEVFTELTVKELNDAIWNNSTFFHFIYDGSEKSKYLKEELEKLGHKFEWNIYITDIDKLYDEALEEEENKRAIKDEKDDFITKYCKYVDITEENINNYSEDDLETDENGKTVVFECSLRVAKEKNPDLNIEGLEEPSYTCNTCNDIRNNILNSLKTDYSTNLILYYNGTPSGELKGYLPDNFEILSKSEKSDVLTEANKNLDEWFESIVNEL